MAHVWDLPPAVASDQHKLHSYPGLWAPEDKPSIKDVPASEKSPSHTYPCQVQSLIVRRVSFFIHLFIEPFVSFLWFLPSFSVSLWAAAGNFTQGSHASFTECHLYRYHILCCQFCLFLFIFLPYPFLFHFPNRSPLFFLFILQNSSELI